MEPTDITSDLLLSQPVTLSLLDDDGASTTVPAELRYDRNDPFAVSLVMGDEDRTVYWCLARELIAEGLHEPCGDGDVHVWPSLDETGRAVLLVELSTSEGWALLQGSQREFMSFIARSNQMVAPGEESMLADVDAAIAAILAAETPHLQD